MHREPRLFPRRDYMTRPADEARRLIRERRPNGFFVRISPDAWAEYGECPEDATRYADDVVAV